MTKKKLVEFIRLQANIDDRKIDNVEVHDIFSFITVPFREAEIILQSLNKKNKGKRNLVEVAKHDQKSRKSRRKK